MQEIKDIYDFIAPHWPGVAWSLIGMLLVQVGKNSIFSKSAAHSDRKGSVICWWGRKTLPLHPVLLGVVLGIFWQNPQGADPPWPWIGSLVYFAAFGVGSSFAFEAIRGLLKSRADIDIGALPGQDDNSCTEDEPPETVDSVDDAVGDTDGESTEKEEEKDGIS